MSKTVVFLNHYQPRCGVYQMGRRIGLTLETLTSQLQYFEGNVSGAYQIIETINPKVIIYNWYPSTMPWASEIITRVPHVKHVGLIHEISPQWCDNGKDVFPYRMVCDPDFPVDPFTFHSVRHIPRYYKPNIGNDIFTVGSFGFAVGGKLFHHIVQLIADTLPGTRIRLHIPKAYYGDDVGNAAAGYADTCRSIAGNKVLLDITHNFLPECELLDWLAKNDLNVFFYEPNVGRGLSSTIDYAIAARCPIAINDSDMFRHVRTKLGYYPKSTLTELLSNASEVERLYQEWSPSRLVQDYEYMFNILESKV